MSMAQLISRFLKSNVHARRGFLVLLSVGALISIVQGVRNALASSQDFQWSPSVLFWNGTNPYSHFLAGNVDGAIILEQAPNYLHALYILFWPFAAVDFDSAKALWAATNIALAIGSCLLVRKIYGLSNTQLLFLVFVFFMSTPLRNGIGNGQQNLLALFMVLSFWHYQGWFKGVSMSLAFTKYSFAPLFFLHALIRRERAVYLALAILFLSAIVFGAWVGDMRPEVLIQPLLVAKGAMSLGTANLMSILRGDLGVNFAFAAVASVASAAMISWLVREAEDAVTLVILSLASLAFFQHRVYDYVFLLPAFGYLLSNYSARGLAWKVSLAATIVYFFFFLKINNDVFVMVGESYVGLLGFSLTLLSIYLLLRLRTVSGIRPGAGPPLQRPG